MAFGCTPLYFVKIICFSSWFCTNHLPPLPSFEAVYCFIAVAEWWLLLDIRWFLLFFLIHLNSLIYTNLYFFPMHFLPPCRWWQWLYRCHIVHCDIYQPVFLLGELSPTLQAMTVIVQVSHCSPEIYTNLYFFSMHLLPPCRRWQWLYRCHIVHLRYIPTCISSRCTFSHPAGDDNDCTGVTLFTWDIYQPVFLLHALSPTLQVMTMTVQVSHCVRYIPTCISSWCIFSHPVMTVIVQVWHCSPEIYTNLYFFLMHFLPPCRWWQWLYRCHIVHLRYIPTCISSRCTFSHPVMTVIVQVSHCSPQICTNLYFFPMHFLPSCRWWQWLYRCHIVHLRYIPTCISSRCTFSHPVMTVTVQVSHCSPEIYSKTRLLRISRDYPFQFAISVIRTKHITNFNEIVGKLRSKRVYKEI